MRAAIWTGVLLITPPLLAAPLAYLVSMALPAKRRRAFALSIPVLILLGYALLRSAHAPNDVDAIVERVFALAAILGLEHGLALYSLRHRNRRTPTLRSSISPRFGRHSRTMAQAALLLPGR
jgi:hypothetical protein